MAQRKLTIMHKVGDQVPDGQVPNVRGTPVTASRVEDGIEPRIVGYTEAGSVRDGWISLSVVITDPDYAEILDDGYQPSVNHCTLSGTQDFARG